MRANICPYLKNTCPVMSSTQNSALLSGAEAPDLYFGITESEIWYWIPNNRMTMQITELPVPKVWLELAVFQYFEPFLRPFWKPFDALKVFNGLLNAFKVFFLVPNYRIPNYWMNTQISKILDTESWEKIPIYRIPKEIFGTMPTSGKSPKALLPLI